MRICGIGWAVVISCGAWGCGDKLSCGEGTHSVDGECVIGADDTGGNTDVDTGDPEVPTDDLDLDSDGDGFNAPTDCDDEDPAVHPEADEYCDGIDNDCDGQIDEADAVNPGIYYRDVDEDGFGDPASPQEACTAPSGTVEDGTDCDDAAANAYPGAEEIWYDGIDNDCLGGADDDLDGDGHAGNAEGTGVDCDDTDPAVSPDAEEICGDGVDNDCDGDLGACRLSGALGVDGANARLLGPGHDAWAGSAVAVSADLTGDGVGDLIVSVPRDDAGAVNAGAVYILPGGLSGLATVDDLGTRIKGTEAGVMAGDFVMASDVNGDGQDDLLVGTLLAPNTTPVIGTEATGDTGDTGATGDTGDTGDTSITIARAGALSIVFGPITSRSKLANADVRLMGWAVDHGMGRTAASLGDQDGDGFAELVIGLPGDDGRHEDAGAVRVMAGPITEDSDPMGGFLLSGDSAGDQAGMVVHAPGDLNGDGIADLIVSAPGFDATPPGSESGETDAGAVYIFLGPILRDRFLSDADGLHLGESAGDGAGGALTSLDANGDGTPDIVVGAAGVDGEHPDAGATYVVLGPGTSRAPLALADIQILGERSGTRVGAAVANGGDVDGDGHADLLVSAPFDAASAGLVSLFHSPIEGSLQMGDAEVRIEGAATNQRLGTSLAGGVDLSGDGVSDIVIGVPGEDTSGDEAGAALIFFGSGI